MAAYTENIDVNVTRLPLALKDRIASSCRNQYRFVYNYTAQYAYFIELKTLSRTHTIYVFSG